MGQYYGVYNKTKKEMIHPHVFDSGAKLLEFGSGGLFTLGLCLLLANSNGKGGGDIVVNPSYDADLNPIPLIGDALKLQTSIDAISGRWAGDEIVIQGDYADKNDPAYIKHSDLESYKSISKLVLKALKRA